MSSNDVGTDGNLISFSFCKLPSILLFGHKSITRSSEALLKLSSNKGEAIKVRNMPLISVLTSLAQIVQGMKGK